MAARKKSVKKSAKRAAKAAKKTPKSRVAKRAPAAKPARKAASAKNAAKSARRRPTAKVAAVEKPVPESLASIRIAVTTIGDLLLTAADRYPESDAVVFPHAKLTYRQLSERALLRARGLQALGVKPRDNVGLLLPSCIGT